ncbi:transcription repressor OFP13-like [Primulina tabacum]|uniref:transcription repressor OFP13-like n=1 Tax=Primulina tabacum TaxID=48773 RepID=UPI003F596B2F
MGKKPKFPFLFRATETAPSWPWPPCTTTPKTLSFRATNNDSIIKTLNSAFLDDTPDSFSSICNHFERESLHENFSGEQRSDADESAVVRGLRSGRLFFEHGETSSILEEAKTHDFPYRDSVSVLAMDSTDPFSDFRASMDEMVESHGLKDCEGLEKLLACYLRINGRSCHGYIIGAFVDLLLHLAFASNPVVDEPCLSCSSSSNATLGSFTSPFSCSSSSCSSISPCLSSLENEDELISVEKNGGSSSSNFSGV